jgi:HEAT repeat protein
VNVRERIRSWLDIRAGEGRSTSLLLLHSFFTGVSTVFFETAASALFLAHYDATLLPFVYLLAALVSILAGIGYTRARTRLTFAPLMMATLALMLAMTVLARLGLGLGAAGWLIFSLMIAYRLLSILTDLEYWAVAARLYDVQQSKRLFGFVGSGEVTARILGSFSVPVLVSVLGVANLLWLSVGGLVACLGLLFWILKSFPEISVPAKEEDQPKMAGPGPMQSMRSTLASRYLQSIFLLAFFAVLGKYFVDFAFLSQMQTRWREVENLATFFGLFSGFTQVVNLLFRIFVSGRLLSRFGILVGLLVLPSAHFLCTLGIAAAASVPLPVVVFWLVIANQGIYKTLKHPVDNPSFKVLYQPLPRRERLSAQIFVEVIVTPMAIALAGALILLFSHSALSDPSYFSSLMILNFGAWCIAVFFAFREYGAALVRALEKRTIDRTAFSLDDERSVALIRAKVGSEHADEVIFALDLLQRIEHPSLALHFGQALSHPSPDVRFHVLLQIEHSRPESLTEAVARVAGDDPSPRVRAVALRALAALGDPTGQVMGHLHHPDREVERGALTGLLQHMDETRARHARSRLLDLARSEMPEDRALSARILGEVHLPEVDTLPRLLSDPVEEVRRAALRAAGRRKEGPLVERIIDHLADPKYRGEAARALIDAGESASPFLARALEDRDRPATLRARIPHIATRIPSFPHQGALWRTYCTEKGGLRQRALEAMSVLGLRASEGEIESIVRRVEAEVADATWKLGIVKDVEPEELLSPLSSALLEEVEQIRERVFILLSFVYGRKTLLSARDNLHSSSREKRAYAAEILEVTLSQELKELTLPLLVTPRAADRLSLLESRFPQPRRGPEGSLAEILGRTDGSVRNWTRACAVYGAARLARNGFDKEIRRLREDPSPLVAETARWAAQSRAETSRDDGSRPMLTIEKVLLLKGVPMFSATSEDTLADVANLLEEVELRTGELVFSKGDLGNSMYIVGSGRVRVFDGEKTINYLGACEIFGELALLDPEPRSASVEACEETRLFRLERDTLFELMSDNVGVMSGIMQVLCRRLRRMTAIATAAGEKR